MTLKELQEFLDAEKWKDSEARACDMCGRYARCRYCVRTEEYPCAMAHDRLIAATSAPVPDRIPDWLLPEPDVAKKFGTPVADETSPKRQAPQAALARAEEGTARVQALPAPPSKTAEQEQPTEEGTAEEERPRPHVIVRGKKGDVCVMKVVRKLPTISSELAG